MKFVRRIAGAEGTASRADCATADTCAPAHAGVQQLMPRCSAQRLAAGPCSGPSDDVQAQAEDPKAEPSNATAVINAQTIRVPDRDMRPTIRRATRDPLAKMR